MSGLFVSVDDCEWNTNSPWKYWIRHTKKSFENKTKTLDQRMTPNLGQVMSTAKYPNPSWCNDLSWKVVEIQTVQLWFSYPSATKNSPLRKTTTCVGLQKCFSSEPGTNFSPITSNGLGLRSGPNLNTWSRPKNKTVTILSALLQRQVTSVWNK